MTQAPTSLLSEDFEFAALTVAENYRHAIVSIFEAQLRGKVLELGAGIGQMSELFVKLPSVASFMGVEPCASYCRAFEQRLPGVPVHEGILSSLDPAPACDAIISVNVFEHIEDDEGEFAVCKKVLEPQHGALCLLVPARPEIYAPIDADFGHFRRYTPDELRRKLERAGFKIETLHYFNLIGYFAWLLNFKLLKSRAFSVKKLYLFDRWIFPAAYFLEKRLGISWWGQSLIAIARS